MKSSSEYENIFDKERDKPGFKYRKREGKILLKNIKQPNRNLESGIVSAVQGNTIIVEGNSEKKSYECIKSGVLVSGHGEDTLVVVGDFVDFLPDSKGGRNSGTIIEVKERFSSISRISAKKKKTEDVIACNAENLAIITSLAEPPFNSKLLDRFLIAAEIGNLKPLIILNKVDLSESDDYTLSGIMEELPELEAYTELNIPFILTSTKINFGFDELIKYLENSTTILIGRSGTGKSSIINALLKNKTLKVGDVSDKTSKGRHTTSAVQRLKISETISLIDTPGVREFGVYGVDRANLPLYFHEFDEYVKQCKYIRCSHTHEPGCEVKEALLRDEIYPDRYESYLNIYDSL